MVATALHSSWSFDPCGSSSNVVVSESNPQDRFDGAMLTPRGSSLEDPNENGTPPPLARQTPKKGALYQNSCSSHKNESEDSSNTNPNQGPSTTPATAASTPSPASRDSTPSQSANRKERPYSPFQDIWNRATGHFSPPLQSLEEGKQLFQKRWSSLFEEPCSACQFDFDPSPALPHQKPSNLHGAAQGARVNAQSPNMSENAARPSPIPTAHLSPKVDLRARKVIPPTSAAYRGSNVSVATHDAIEVNSEHEVKVVEPVAVTGIPLPSKTKRAPLELLEVKSEDAIELERSISELTMRSSYGGGEHLSKIPDNRRMAYYAVGKHHRQSGRGGNRRCYFSGKLILGGAPFYAGAVQQGLRTLVVFCLPSAIHLPDRDRVLQHSRSTSSRKGSHASVIGSGGSVGGILRDTQSRGNRSISGTRSGGARPMEKRPSSGRGKRKFILNQNNSMSSYAGNDGGNSIASRSRISSLDDLSLSIEGDLDPNWGLDREFLLKVLPDPDRDLLDKMAALYPEQFDTLPVQVRSASRWRLYVKFCFFSGLPIAEGEMHYKVFDEIAEQVYGEEIVLSHDVMEAANGDISAEILQLPNLKVFRYLRKHYAQQCSKLDDRVFRRAAWLRVAPEV